MSTFKKQYDQFQLSPKQCDDLQQLADPRLHLPRTTDRLIVETILIEDGERRVVKKEEQGAQLV